MSQFTYQLLNCILSSWNALVKYFQSSQDKERSGFLQCLPKFETLKILVILADLLSIFARYQRKVQSDSLTIFDADLKEVHEILYLDLDIQALGQEYDAILQLGDIEELRSKRLPDLIRILSASDFYKTTTIAFSRILAVKPHSADGERVISCSNILKIPKRSCMNLDTKCLL